jgi:ACT domain-containing protein
MSNPIETQILEAEKCLRLAMLNSDVSAVDDIDCTRTYFYKFSWSKSELGIADIS